MLKAWFPLNDCNCDMANNWVPLQWWIHGRHTWHTPLRILIFSFWHTIFTKHNHVGSWHPHRCIDFCCAFHIQRRKTPKEIAAVAIVITQSVWTLSILFHLGYVALSWILILKSNVHLWQIYKRNLSNVFLSLWCATEARFVIIFIQKWLRSSLLRETQ